jgi:hypothetical protein
MKIFFYDMMKSTIYWRLFSTETICIELRSSLFTNGGNPNNAKPVLFTGIIPFLCDARGTSCAVTLR